MSKRADIENVLMEAVALARTEYDRAHQEFIAISSDIPSGLPYPDATLRIQSASRAVSLARDHYARALIEFNDFVIRAKIPAGMDAPKERRE